MTPDSLWELWQVILIPAFGAVAIVLWYLIRRINEVSADLTKQEIEMLRQHPTRSDFQELKAELKSELSGLRVDMRQYHTDIQRVIERIEYMSKTNAKKAAER